jgi:hypothetical protein
LAPGQNQNDPTGRFPTNLFARLAFFPRFDFVFHPLNISTMKAHKIFFTVFFLGCALQLFAQNPLVGTWEIKTDSTRSIKIISPTHWMVFTEALNGDSSKFVRSHGGTYTLTSDKYIEHINIASWPDYGKEKTDFTYKVTGDKFFMKGPLTLGDGTVIPIDEVWQKVNAVKSYPKNPALGTWNQLSSSYTMADGKHESLTNATATRFEIITPTHWIRISHRDNKFEDAFGGTYSLEGNKMISVMDFASFPIDKNGKAEIAQKVTGDKAYFNGTLKGGDGKMILTFKDVFQKVNGKPQIMKTAVKK